MSQRTLLLLSQDNAHYERLLKAAHLPHLRILRADNQSDAEKLIGIDGHPTGNFRPCLTWRNAGDLSCAKIGRDGCENAGEFLCLTGAAGVPDVSIGIERVHVRIWQCRPHKVRQ